MRVLVTGACGFVGPYLVNELVNSSHEVFATVLSEEVLTEDPARGPACRGVALASLTNNIIQLNVTDPKACGEVIGEVKPDAVCHLAGMAFAPDAAAHFSSALAVNVAGVFNVCQALSDHVPEATFLYVSSGEVYGKISPEELPISEELEPLPMNPYSVTKLQGEEVVRYFDRRTKLRTVIARPFNHIGPEQSEKFVCSSFAAQLARIANKQHEPVLSVGNLEARRDFTDVRDIVRGYVHLLSATDGVYNLSQGRALSIQEILDHLIELSGVEVKVEQDSARMRPSEVEEIIGSNKKMKKQFGWTPEFSVKDSLAEIYNHYLQKTSTQNR